MDVGALARTRTRKHTYCSHQPWLLASLLCCSPQLDPISKCIFSCSHTVLFLFFFLRLHFWNDSGIHAGISSFLTQKFVASNNRPGPEVGTLFTFRWTHSCLYFFSPVLYFLLLPVLVYYLLFMAPWFPFVTVLYPGWCPWVLWKGPLNKNDVHH